MWREKLFLRRGSNWFASPFICLSIRETPLLQLYNSKMRIMGLFHNYLLGQFFSTIEKNVAKWQRLSVTVTSTTV